MERPPLDAATLEGDRTMKTPRQRMNAENKRHTQVKNGLPVKRLRERTAFEEALDANDEAGMPEGAAWALAEEMAGLECGEGIDHLTDFDDDHEEDER
jgi:hypothetical protein